MDKMDILYIVIFSIIIVFVLVYVAVTTAILNKQDETIVALIVENEQLKKARKQQASKGAQVVAIYEQPKGVDIPSYDKEW